MYDNFGNLYFNSEFITSDNFEKNKEKNILFKKKTNLYKELFSFIFYKSLKNYQNHRNILIWGGLQYGKTLFIKTLIYETKFSSNLDDLFFIGSRKDEKIMKTTLKMNPVSFFYFQSNNTSCLFNLLDTPGHSNLSDEIESGFRISDGIVLLIDCVEGVNILTKKLLNKIIYFKKNCFIVYSKLDKVVFELKIPPEETMKKLTYITNNINQIIFFLGYNAESNVFYFFFLV